MPQRIQLTTNLYVTYLTTSWMSFLVWMSYVTFLAVMLSSSGLYHLIFVGEKLGMLITVPGSGTTPTASCGH